MQYETTGFEGGVWVLLEDTDVEVMWEDVTEPDGTRRLVLHHRHADDDGRWHL